MSAGGGGGGGSAGGAEDLAGVDHALVASLDKLRRIEDEGVTREMFEFVIYEAFDALATDGRRVELEPGGSGRRVTWETRARYADAVERFRLHEFDAAAALVRRGLAATLPLPLLSLFTHAQFETLVCGAVEVDLALLRAHTTYEGCAARDAHVGFFWEVMEGLAHEERRAFLRFTWGRSRLPLDHAGFDQQFKIQAFGRHPPDRYYPVAHTCFFSLELPAYSSLAVTRERLRYAIHNCEAIDGDQTGVGNTAAALGFDVEVDDEED